MRSHALLRTNTGLTTNAKFVVGTNYELYLDCIDSRPELNDVKYRKFRFQKENYWDELVPFFFKDTPVEVSYSVKYDADNSTMFTDFSKQYDDLYNYGARNIADNKDYKEEFEYFAPLHLSKTGLPTHFIIFRVDGTGLIELHKDNFRDEILENMKVVTVFDMTPKSDLGEFLRRNISENINFPVTSLEVNFSKLEFSYFIGIDYETGGYTKRSQMLESTFESEFTFMDMERFIYKGFADNRIVYPHIINFSFLFDDTPATPTSLRKWSINRYLGFYMNQMKYVVSVTPNKFPSLKEDIRISSDNDLVTSDGTSPFIDENELNPYIEIEGQIYKVEKYTIQGEAKRTKVRTEGGNFIDRIVAQEIVKYKILCDVELVGKESLINSNVVSINTEENETPILLQGSLNDFQINDFEDSDMWIIKIGEKYHKLKKNIDGQITIFSDYAFKQSEDKFEYYINESDPSFRTAINLVSNSITEPVKFEIYRCEFTDIKDWDTDIVETEFSKFEYEEDEILTENDEPKFYVTNLLSSSKPKDYDDFLIGGEVANIPVSSEYTANNELFRLVENDLNELWRKNPIRVKWGYQNSISDGDYPYLLNNAFIADDFNKTVNPYITEVSRQEKNLDYFYTINPESVKFTNQTLHIKPFGDTLDTSYKFDVIKYLNKNLDYFTYFFGQKTDLLNSQIIKNTNKWSYFNSSDGISTNTTLFRGIKLKIFEVSSVNLKSGLLDKINVRITNKFEDYKLSILTSENTTRVVQSADDFNRGITQSFYNTMNWTIIDNWKMDKTYLWNQMTIWNNQLYITTGNNSTPTRKETDPHTNPGKQEVVANPKWKDLSSKYTRNPANVSQTFILETPFWSLSKNSDTENFNFSAFPQIHPFAYIDGDWWYDTGVPGQFRFWTYNNYFNGNKTIFNGKVWMAVRPPGNTDPVKEMPGRNDRLVVSTKVGGKYDFVSYPFWTQTNDSVFDRGRWRRIPLWDSSKSYTGESKVGTPAIPSRDGLTYLGKAFDIVLYNDTVYGLTGPSTVVVAANSSPPDSNPNWVRLYSLKPDKDFVYDNSFTGNNIIQMNNRYYMYLKDSSVVPSTFNVDVIDGTLDNGITVYINQKFKNVLINIYINDHTYDDSILNLPATNPVFPTPSSVSNITKLGNKLRETNRDDIYSDIFKKLSANNFMTAMNDLSNKYDFINAVKYVITDELGDVKIYDFDNLQSVTKLPFLITCEGPDEFFVKLDSYKVEPITTDTNLLKPRFLLNDGNILSKEQINYVSDIPTANTIESNRVEKSLVPNFTGLKNEIFNKMYRHSGFYSPIFKNIELFTAYTETKNLGNFKFDTSLTEFGMTGERILSKVNRGKNILKLNNVSSAKSIYPMLDEFGYHIVRTFIFKSTWDFKYHYETVLPANETRISSKLIQKQVVNDKTTGNKLL